MSACLLCLVFAAGPNVVFLLADDLGHGDLGCTGHPYARTPAIDKLASEGTRFARFYVGGATCCPSRTAFMTGRFPATFARYPATFGFSGATTLTDIFHSAGYKTGHLGKWHIGDEQKPGTFGLDQIEISGGNRKDARGRDAVIADRAIAFLKANKGGRFYLNVWFHTPHAPVAPPESFRTPFAGVKVNPDDFINPDMKAHLTLYKKLGGDLNAGMKAYLGDVAQLDSQVARILRAIDDFGLRKNTLVIFSSDNGPATCSGGAKERRLKDNMLGSAGPFRERKHSLYDGGIRTPLILRWPGTIPADRVEEKTAVAAVDFVPTLAALTECRVPDRIDGEDMSDVWRGTTRERTKDLCWKASNPKDSPALLRSWWKAHLSPRTDIIQLYDTRTDPGERVDLALKQPVVARTLGTALRKWNATLPRSYEKVEDE